MVVADVDDPRFPGSLNQVFVGDEGLDFGEFAQKPADVGAARNLVGPEDLFFQKIDFLLLKTNSLSQVFGFTNERRHGLHGSIGHQRCQYWVIRDTEPRRKACHELHEKAGGSAELLHHPH